MKERFKAYIGDRAFYKMLLRVVVPIIIQNFITNFVGLLDNIMVGRIGTEQMSGVSISNQFIFIFNLCIFGAVSGAGIFTAQFYGSGDHEGVRNTMRFKILITLLLGAFATVLFGGWGQPLTSLYLKGEGSAAAIAATSQYAVKYMDVMLLGLIPFALVQAYSGTLRECGETLIPMYAGLIAVFVNLGFNYILIYGKLGFPVLGVVGAAIATVISRYVELLIVVIYAHTHKERFLFIKGLYKRIFIPKDLAWKIIKTGTPLLINETLWAGGVSMNAWCYSLRGIDVVGGMNISNTLTNLFGTMYIAMGSATAIIVGQELGAGKIETVKNTVKKLLFAGIIVALGVTLALLASSTLFPKAYNTTEVVRNLATGFICSYAICAPLFSITNISYFTLRSGGKTIVTFLFDSVFVWVVTVPIAFVLSYYTTLPIVLMVFCVQVLEVLKCIIGLTLVKKGVWINNMVADA